MVSERVLTKIGLQVQGKDIPIVHRVVRKFGAGPKAKLLTKGDNNLADDTGTSPMRYVRGGPKVCND